MWEMLDLEIHHTILPLLSARPQARRGMARETLFSSVLPFFFQRASDVRGDRKHEGPTHRVALLKTSKIDGTESKSERRREEWRNTKIKVIVSGMVSPVKIKETW